MLDIQTVWQKINRFPSLPKVIHQKILTNVSPIRNLSDENEKQSGFVFRFHRKKLTDSGLDRPGKLSQLRRSFYNSNIDDNLGDVSGRSNF